MVPRNVDFRAPFHYQSGGKLILKTERFSIFQIFLSFSIEKPYFVNFPRNWSVLGSSDLRSTVVEALAASRESRKRRELSRKRCQRVRSTSRMSSVTFYNHPRSIREPAASCSDSYPEVAFWCHILYMFRVKSKMTAYI